MSPLAGRPVTKMNGLGNEILILDLRRTTYIVQPAEARALAEDKALAFDQLMVLHDPVDAASAAFLRILNTDGSESSSCGNGTRCVAWFLGRETGGTHLRLDSAAGPLFCQRLGEWRFSVDMGPPRFGWADMPLRHAVRDMQAVPIGADHGLPPAHLVSMGNPHAVFFPAPGSAPVIERLGPILEHDALFPERANISFAEIIARDHLRLRVWERGAGATRACGTAACATLVAAARAGLAERRAMVTLPGGDLTIDWRDDDHVIMEGPVELEAETRIDPRLLEDVAA